MLESLRVILGAAQVITGSHGDIQADIMRSLSQSPPPLVARLNIHTEGENQDQHEPPTYMVTDAEIKIIVGVFCILPPAIALLALEVHRAGRNRGYSEGYIKGDARGYIEGAIDHGNAQRKLDQNSQK